MAAEVDGRAVDYGLGVAMVAHDENAGRNGQLAVAGKGSASLVGIGPLHKDGIDRSVRGYFRCGADGKTHVLLRNSARSDGGGEFRLVV